MVRVFPPARIVALVVIGILSLGLIYTRFSGDERLTVPAGAKAGALTLAPCTYPTERGSYAADCGSLIVPENRSNPSSRLIALPVKRIRARSGHSSTAIFRLEGGPGVSNMTFPFASRLAIDHDVVLVGYRGVEGSSVLDCPEVSSALSHSKDFLSTSSFRAYSDGFKACARRLKHEGVDVAGYTLGQRVDDFEAARIALGYGPIDLVSESAGTRTALVYSWRYPKSIHRSAMIGVNPPGHFLWDPATTDQLIARYSELCAKDAGCSARTDDLVASMKATVAHLPDHWLFLPIKKGNVRVASFFGLFDSAPEAQPLSAPMTIDTWLSAATGEASGFWFQSFMADFAFPSHFVWGDAAATTRQDVAAARAHFAAGTDDILGDPGNQFLWGGGGLADAWPAGPGDNEYDHVIPSDTETLLVSGTLDFTTPATFATEELLPSLTRGHQVVLAELGHTTDFWNYKVEASTRLLTAFFDRGAVDDSLYPGRTIDFQPDTTQALVAKVVVSIFGALGLLTILSVLAMRRRVRRRGGFGRTSGIALRSVYPIVLGLGGWCGALLLVMTARLHVAFDSSILAVLSIGTPIGAGTFWAWMRRERAASVARTGMWGALGGALVGAWFGFGAAPGITALLTTIVGATVGANLFLIVLDIAQDRASRQINALS
jgi:pimeloyl-ACP methyl ester carboxylesterase